MLPRLGQRIKRGQMELEVLAAANGESGVDLSGHHAGEHVQDLVAVIAGVKEPAGGPVDLGWVTVGDLVGDDLVHREMQADVHRLAADHDLVLAALERLLQVG